MIRQVMIESIEDPTPFLKDRCWMFVHLARRANVGVILRHGPTEWWRVTLWDTGRDGFEGGQWFRGRMYPDKCDVSPNGKLFIYFAGQFHPRNSAKRYTDTWTAVSRPPYLTALGQWPIGDTSGGRGVFLDDRTVLVWTSSPSLGASHRPDHVPDPLRVIEHRDLEEGDPRRTAEPSWLSGWQGIPAPAQPNPNYPGYAAWRKMSGGFILEREAEHGGGTVNDGIYPSKRPSRYTLYRPREEPVAWFDAHWADWDRQGRLVATVGGRVLAAKLTRGRTLLWRQLAAMNEDQPVRMETPGWAQRW
jgi:hypothetical protein